MPSNLPGTEIESEEGRSHLDRLFARVAEFQFIGMAALRLGLVIVLPWIGALKFANYEADGIVPLIANSPFASFLYAHKPPEYRQYMNKEGEALPSHQHWHEGNRTYPVSHGLGIIIIALGLMIALHPLAPRIATVESFLLVGMSCVTLSFLVTTPEAWVPALGGANSGFPYLSGGRSSHRQRLHHAWWCTRHHVGFGQGLFEGERTTINVEFRKGEA